MSQPRAHFGSHLLLSRAPHGSTPGALTSLDRSPICIGRGSDNDVMLNGDGISRRHAHLERRLDGLWWIVDDGSINGTRVNDEPLDLERALQSLDRITIGSSVFTFLDGPDAEAHLAQSLRSLSETDALTGVGNRRLLFARLESALAEARQDGGALSVAMFDIDHFKHIQDRVTGHGGGDFALVDLAQFLASQSKEVGPFCRHGGEEFVLLLPGVPLVDALALCDSLREAVAQHQFIAVYGGERIPFTVSVGVAALEASDRTGVDLIARADARMHEAKATGRNRVCG